MRLLYWIAAVSVGMVSLSAWAAEPGTFRVADYFPLEGRNLWESYSYHNEETAPYDLEARAPRSVDDPSLLRLIFKHKLRPQEDWYMVKITDEGLLYYGDSGDEIEKPALLLPNPIPLGHKWETQLERKKQGETISITGEIADKLEKLTLYEKLDRAEQVEAVRVTWTIKVGEDDLKMVCWLVKGIGPAKVDVHRGDDLVEYKLFEFTNATRRAAQEKALREFLDEDW